MPAKVRKAFGSGFVFLRVFAPSWPTFKNAKLIHCHFLVDVPDFFRLFVFRTFGFYFVFRTHYEEGHYPA